MLKWSQTLSVLKVSYAATVKKKKKNKSKNERFYFKTILIILKLKENKHATKNFNLKV